MNWTLEVVVVPVSDVERARAFYAEKLGFAVDHDRRVSETRRVVQLTPRGSGCSIVIGTGLSRMAPGSLQGLQLVVRDARAAHAELVARGVTVSEVQVLDSRGQRPATPQDELQYVGFFFFQDPDGNGWAVQQIDRRP